MIIINTKSMEVELNFSRMFSRLFLYGSISNQQQNASYLVVSKDNYVILSGS